MALLGVQRLVQPLLLLSAASAWLSGGPTCPRRPVMSPPRHRLVAAIARPRHVRNEAAQSLVKKLAGLRSTPTAAVDLAGMDRVLRGAEGLQGSLLLDVLVGLKDKGRWQLCHAVARWIEAAHAHETPSRGRPRRGERRSGEQRQPRPRAVSPTDDESGLDMGALLAGGTALPSLVPVDTSHYSVLISACAAPRRWREAMELRNRMVDRGVPRDTVTYNALLNVLQRSGRWKLALKLLKQMRRDKVPPDTITFSTAIAAVGKAGQCRRALLLLPSMASARVAPNTITFSSCISACERRGEWRGALELLGAMRALGVAPDLICVNAAIGACARAGEPEEARRLLREALPAGGAAGEAADAVSYNGVITALANAEPARWEEALATLGEMRAAGVPPNLYSCNAALAALGKAAQWQRGLELLAAMPAEHGVAADAVSYTSVLSGCQRAEEWMAAAQLLRQMRAAGVAPTTLTYSKVLLAHAAAGEWRAAAALAEDISADRLLHNALTLNRLMRACLDAPPAERAAAAAAALGAALPPLRASTATVPGPLTFDAESVQLLEALLGARRAGGGAPADAGLGEEVGGAEWEAAAEAEVEAADAAAAAAAEVGRLLPKLYPLVAARAEAEAARARADAQLAAQFEAAFPAGLQAAALAKLWQPDGAAD